MKQLISICLMTLFLGLVMSVTFLNVQAQKSEPSSVPQTKVIILGVSHSQQLVAESDSPSVLRAFIERVKPDAICLERSPEEFARNNFYEFTYEQQYLAVPYARERHIPLYPVDWLPAAEDQSLAFGISDLDEPPFARNDTGFQGFLNFPDKSALSLDLFEAESESSRQDQQKFANTVAPQMNFDFPRRLYLYRTFMQAMRIAKAVNVNRGGTILVIIGSLHKNDLEQILKTKQVFRDGSAVQIVQPSVFGHPEASEITKATKREDLLAVATFNLLGVQSKSGNVNWDWMSRILARLEEAGQTAETLLLKTRLQVLQRQLTAQEALNNYRKAGEIAQPDEQFTWTGVRDRSRIDSYFDPFGNLSTKQRAMLETARENNKLKRPAAVEEIRKQLSNQLSGLQAQQLAAYRDQYLLQMI